MSQIQSIEEFEETLRCLQDGTSAVRRVAAAFLGESSTDDERAIHALLEALNDRDAAVRLEAAHALRCFGDPAVAALEAVLPNAERKHREALFQTLGFLAPDVPSAATLLKRLQYDPAHGLLAERALEIALRAPTDWNAWVDRLGPWLLVCGIVLGVANELLSWVGVLSWTPGIALKVAVGWGGIGAFGGAIGGARWGGRTSMHWTAKQMGFLGAIAGALVGRTVASLLVPLLSALGR